MNKKLKDTLFILGIVIGSIIAFLIITFVMRAFSSATTLIILKTPKPGIECATMVTGDGAAIDCWKTNDE